MAQLAAKASQQHGLRPEDVKNYIHVIFGLSKDWCASGLRVGCLWTLNAQVQAAQQNISYFCEVSGIAEYMIAEMLEDLSFVDTYLKENARRLGGAYDTLAGVCNLPCIRDWCLHICRDFIVVFNWPGRVVY